MKKLIAITAILCLAFSMVQAQKIIEKNIKVKNQDRLYLDFEFADEIKINGWEKNEIYIKISVDINNNEHNDHFVLDIHESDRDIDIVSDIENMKEISQNKVVIRKSKDGGRTITYNDRFHIDMEIYVEIFMPKNMEIEAETITGDYILKNTGAEIDIETISGIIDISLDKKEKASVETSTISGGVYSNHDVEMKDNRKGGKYHIVISRSPKFNLNGGGRLIKLETISGDIFIR